MKYLYFFIVCFLLGCSPKFKIGKYASTRNNNYFEFKSDSTFIYEYKLFHLYKYAIGTWKVLDDNTLLLNSAFKDSVVSLRVKESESKEQTLSVKLKVKHGLSLPNYYCQLYINGSLPFFRDNTYSIYHGKRCDSVSKIVLNEKIDSIYFVIDREPVVVTGTSIPDVIRTQVYKPSMSRSSLDVNIELNDSLFYRRVFNNEKLRIKKKKIELYNNDTKKWEKIKKVSDSLNIISSPYIK